MASPDNKTTDTLPYLPLTYDNNDNDNILLSNDDNPLSSETGYQEQQEQELNQADLGRTKASQSELFIDEKEGAIRRALQYVLNEREEILTTLKLAWPVVFSFLMSFLQLFINLVFVGHLPNIEDEEHAPEFPAAAFGSTFISVTGFSIINGMLSAVDTLCSQANGAGNYKKVGYVIQRAILIYTVACIPVGFLWYFSESIFLLLITRVEVAQLAGEFTRMMLPGIWFCFLWETLKRWLQAQSNMKPIMYISTIAVPICIGFEYLNVFVLKLGFKGCPLAISETYIAMSAMMVGYLVVSGTYKKTWTGWSKEAFQDWGEYLKLAIPGTMMMCAEWWGFEITVIAAGELDATGVQIAAHSIGYNTLGWAFMVPLGLGIAASTRVGNFLGANNPAAARKSALITIGITVFCELLIMIILFSIRRLWSQVYNNDPDIIDLTTKIVGIAAFTTVFDGLQGVFSGILRGCAKQKVGAVLNLIAYYLISLPIGLPLAFLTSLKIFGIWIGLTIGIAFMAIAAFIVIVRTDWAESARAAVAANAVSAGGDDKIDDELSSSSIELNLIHGHKTTSSEIEDDTSDGSSA